jgi:myosin-crossreactive antigen
MDRNAKVKNERDSSINVYLNGLGLGSIAAAMYLIQRADFNPLNIHVFEQMGDKLWRAMFAFQPWHSAVEMKRYMRTSSFTRCRT